MSIAANPDSCVGGGSGNPAEGRESQGGCDAEGKPYKTPMWRNDARLRPPSSTTSLNKEPNRLSQDGRVAEP